MKKIITYVMIFTMLITTAAVSMAVPASAAVKKQSKRQVTLIRSYNKIYRKCKKNFKYDGSQLEMNQDSYKEFKIWDKELNRVYKLLYKGLSAKQKKVLKKKQIRWIKKKEKEAPSKTSFTFLARSTNERSAAAGRGARYEILSHCGCASGGGAGSGAPLQ